MREDSFSAFLVSSTRDVCHLEFQDTFLSAQIPSQPSPLAPGVMGPNWSGCLCPFILHLEPLFLFLPVGWVVSCLTLTKVLIIPCSWAIRLCPKAGMSKQRALSVPSFKRGNCLWAGISKIISTPKVLKVFVFVCVIVCVFCFWHLFTEQA